MPYKLKGKCVVLADSGKVVKCHPTRAKALAHLKALKVNVPEASSAIAELQIGKPQLTTVADVQIIKTGIEYPLSTGPATFTPDDLASAVAAQSDPSIPQPRIWIGHPDDKRFHGVRTEGQPSGEPAVGKVTDMRLTEDGHCIVGDLSGVPLWFGNIMASAFPSRSIEGRFNVKTPTGKKHRLVITGLAMLGITWPGILTLEDIASLYTKKGPKVNVSEASEDKPVAVMAMAARKVDAQVTVEDLRRQWYEQNGADPNKMNWWLRSIFIEPNELIVDTDDGGTLFRQTFKIVKDKVKFGKPKQVKIKYVNASYGGIESEPVQSDGQRIAYYSSRGESTGSNVLTVNLKPTGSYIEVKTGGSP